MSKRSLKPVAVPSFFFLVLLTLMQSTHSLLFYSNMYIYRTSNTCISQHLWFFQPVGVASPTSLALFFLIFIILCLNCLLLMNNWMTDFRLVASSIDPQWAYQFPHHLSPYMGCEVATPLAQWPLHSLSNRRCYSHYWPVMHILVSGLDNHPSRSLWWSG